MPTFRTDLGPARDASVMVVGVGGLGCPAALALVRAGVGRVILVDDDQVDETNLHRQILFGEHQVGRHKLDAAKETLLRRGAAPRGVELRHTRFLPDTAEKLLGEADIVVEGADNFATKFLTADACFLAGKPVVHGAGIRFTGNAWLVSPLGAPCYRCLFEDLPGGGAQPNCAEAGVMGPVVGLLGALMADLALSWLVGDTSALGKLHTYDGKADRLRAIEVARRPGCPLCDTHAITDLRESRYTTAVCAA